MSSNAGVGNHNPKPLPKRTPHRGCAGSRARADNLLWRTPGVDSCWPLFVLTGGLRQAVRNSCRFPEENRPGRDGYACRRERPRRGFQAGPRPGGRSLPKGADAKRRRAWRLARSRRRAPSERGSIRAVRAHGGPPPELRAMTRLRPSSLAGKHAQRNEWSHNPDASGGMRVHRHPLLFLILGFRR